MATNNNGSHKQPSRSEGGHGIRCLFLYGFLILFAGALAWHLYYLQFDTELSTYYRDVVAKNWDSYARPQARRGNIYYRDGASLLATNRKLAQVVIDPTQFQGENETESVQILAGFVDIPAPELLQMIRNHPNKGLELENALPIATAIQLDNARLENGCRLPGVYTRYYYERFYPQGEYGAAMTVGYAGENSALRSGVENILDARLTGEDGYVLYARDRQSQALPETINAKDVKQDGEDVTLSLSHEIQFICEDELREALDKNRAEWGLILVMDPHNGEIMGLATHPTCDPNAYARGEIRGAEFNVLTQRLYEPGSTVKPILSAYALDRGWLDPKRRFRCDQPLTIGKYTIREALKWQSFGGPDGLTISEIINKSSNIGMARVATSLGQDYVLESFEQMGFFERTGIELPGEYRGYRPYNYAQCKTEKKLTWPRITLANTGFGQGLSITPLQVARAYCIIANGGYWVEPTLLLREEVVEAETTLAGPALPPGWELVEGVEQATTALGQRLSDPAHAGELGRVRVLTAETCNTINGWLCGVVNNGTGTKAQLDHLQAAGKTGTAQVYDTKGGYAKGQYTASFCGYFPADNPRYVVLTLFCKPRGEYYGGAVAAPVFSEVGNRITHLDRLSQLEAVSAP